MTNLLVIINNIPINTPIVFKIKSSTSQYHSGNLNISVIESWKTSINKDVKKP